jgi:hypothetical protein
MPGTTIAGSGGNRVAQDKRVGVDRRLPMEAAYESSIA